MRGKHIAGFRLWAATWGRVWRSRVCCVLDVAIKQGKFYDKLSQNFIYRERGLERGYSCDWK